MNVTRGATLKIRSSTYVDKTIGQMANLTGSTIKSMLKRNLSDSDADAIATKQTGSGVVVIGNAADGIHETTFTAAEINAISQNVVFFETVVKLASGEFIRSGIDRINVEGNVVKTLF